MIPSTDITDPTLKRLMPYAQSVVPGFNIVYKDASTLMKILGGLTFFNPKFMSEYTTTIGTTMYVPRADFLGLQGSYVEVVCHELVHMRQTKQQGLLYYVKYFFPQWLVLLSLFAILAVLSPYFLFFLITLAALAPFPAPGRRELEFEGYRMSLCVRYWQSSQLLEPDFTFIARQFTGSAYYFMWPFYDGVLRDLKIAAQDIRTGAVLKDPLYSDIARIVRG